MATKTEKKKPAKTAAKTAKSKPASAKAASTVIPFSPMAAEALQAMSKQTPEFKTYYSAMETAMSNYKDQYEKMAGDASAAVKQSVESYVQFGTSMMKGYEAILKTCMEMAQESAERNSAAMKNLMACRTLNEAADAQNKLVQANVDEAM